MLDLKVLPGIFSPQKEEEGGGGGNCPKCPMPDLPLHSRLKKVLKQVHDI